MGNKTRECEKGLFFTSMVQHCFGFRIPQISPSLVHQVSLLHPSLSQQLVSLLKLKMQIRKQGRGGGEGGREEGGKLTCSITSSQKGVQKEGKSGESGFVPLFCHFLQQNKGVREEIMRRKNLDHRMKAHRATRNTIRED